MRFFTSDHHFNHYNIIKYSSRPYRDVAEMNAALINNWNNTVSNDDEVFYLGDFSMKIDVMLATLPKLNGKLHLIAGNHDDFHPANKRCKGTAAMSKIFLDAGWSTVRLEDNLLLKDSLSEQTLAVKLCHMPYRDDGGGTDEDRHLRHKLIDNGMTLLCGHVHNLWRMKRTSGGTLMVNVGVDVSNYTPISEDALMRFIFTEEICDEERR
jgi:calcineurin-like phosphoesterase family protein